MERFLRYSLERQRPIRLLFEADGRFCQVNAQVTGYDGETVRFSTLRPRRECCLTRAQLLSADYRKGDEGQE